MTRTDQEQIVTHTEDCSFFQGTREEIVREAKKWIELPDMKENSYRRSIGYAILDTLQ